ncbi:hypothetical protein LHU53_12300 [Rhodoferax sp. U2-2l]|uniref:hypothetical protein n=1 Tax=Rhodoferax sp. U2-2l TaxID=2884000 RepID=UPI001D0BAA37|nr:hypothetical protein [Rhodoferax sp. U2-2l]MCB8747686.1 hypothetical protein [Rhodoferax sp. U2-2l]
MLAIKKARKLIEANPNDAASQTIAALVVALESATTISVAQLYSLDDKRFALALEILDEWRLDRHYASKLRLLDSSNLVQELKAPPDTVNPAA